MASVAGREPLFHRGSHVLEYWLANSEGFALAPRRLRRGRVETVVRDPEAQTVDALVVRSGPLRRRRIVQADAVAAVDPAARVLLVEQRPRRRVPVRAGLERTRDVLLPALALAARLARAAALALAHGIAWTAPRVVAATTAAAAAARVAARRARLWLRPRAETAWSRIRADARRARLWLQPRAAEALRRTAVLARAGGARASSSVLAAVAWTRPRVAGGLRAAAEHARSRLG